MKLNNKAIKEFKLIWKKEFGKEITDNEADLIGRRLLNFFDILLKVNSKKKIKPKQ